MFKFAFLIILLITNNFIGSKTQRVIVNRVIYSNNKDSSQESSEESSRNSLKIHSPSTITFRESEQDFLGSRRNRLNNEKSILETIRENTRNTRLNDDYKNSNQRTPTFSTRVPDEGSESERDTNRLNIFWKATTEKNSYHEASSEGNSVVFGRNENSFNGRDTIISDTLNQGSISKTSHKEISFPSNATANWSIIEPVIASNPVMTYPKPNEIETENETSNYVNFNTIRDNETPIFKNIKNTKRKKQRLCEQKYTEYMTRIFNDDDTVADGIDSDFDGRVLVEPGEYPHMTAIGFTAPDQPTDYKCGGSLISENFVVTAAHCTNLTGQAPKKVRIGDLNLIIEERYLEPQIRNISRIYKHPEYSSHLYYNDIALLELEEPVEFTEFVRPIRLWVDMEIPENTTAHAMGYGATAFGKARTNRLTDMNLTIVPNEACNRDMPEMPETPLGIISSQICARDYLMNRDTCQGDSGGPLQLNLRGRRRRNRKHYHLIGITSFGLFCRSGHPSVYTRVSEFLDWIEQVVWLSQRL